MQTFVTKVVQDRSQYRMTYRGDRIIIVIQFIIIIVVIVTLVGFHDGQSLQFRIVSLLLDGQFRGHSFLCRNFGLDHELFLVAIPFRFIPLTFGHHGRHNGFIDTVGDSVVSIVIIIVVVVVGCSGLDDDTIIIIIIGSVRVAIVANGGIQPVQQNLSLILWQGGRQGIGGTPSQCDKKVGPHLPRCLSHGFHQLILILG